ncbi:hypothetical protein [Flavobacterium sp.]|uniref:hypothetical protein n=1 Tax=Flavobacterium sp. TaxID=239 RepID=UPI004033336A
MATPYRKKAYYEESLRILSVAEEKYIAINDNIGLATVYGEMASNYNMMLKGSEAIPYLIKAIAILEKQKNPARWSPLSKALPIHI